MRSTLKLSLVCLAGCVGAPAATTARTRTNVSPAVELSACEPAGNITTAADGILRCRELPFEIRFPAGVGVERIDETDYVSSYAAQLDRGILALIVEPTNRERTATELTKVADEIASTVEGATHAPEPAPSLPGASASAAVSFKTADGGLGIVRAYSIDHWTVAVMAGAHAADAIARPDKPAGAAFLASLKARSHATGNVTIDLPTGAHLDIPASAWRTRPQAGDEWKNRFAARYAIVDRAEGLVVADRDPEMCEATPALEDLPSFLAQQIILPKGMTIEHAAKKGFGDVAFSFDETLPDGNLAVDFVCLHGSLVQLEMSGKQPIARLHSEVDAIARTLRK
jgi:hypothetical protein